MITEKNVKNYLKIKKAYENDTSIAIIEDVASTVLNNTEKRQYNSKEDEEQSKIIRKLIETYKDKKLDNDNDEEIEEIKKAIANIMDLELKKIDIDIRFDPEDSMKEDKNDILLECREKSEDDSPRGDEENPPCTETQRKSPKYTTLRNKDGELGEFYPRSIFGKDKVVIYLGEFKEGLTSEDKEKRINTCKELACVVFHELRHYKQFLLQNQGISSKKNMLFAKDNALYVLSPEFYEENYEELMIENDAYFHACKRLEEVLGSNEYINQAKIYFEEKICNGIYEMPYEYDEFSKETRSEAYLFVNNIIKQDEERKLFKMSPILSKEYDIDTLERIRLTQLISEMNSEQQFLSNLKDVKAEDKEALKKDAKEMYYDVIYQTLMEQPRQGEIKDAILDYGIENIEKLLEEIEEYKQREINRGLEKAGEVYSLNLDGGNPFIVYFDMEKDPQDQLIEREEILGREKDSIKNTIESNRFIIEEIKEILREFLKKDNKRLQNRLKEVKKADDKAKEQQEKEQEQKEKEQKQEEQDNNEQEEKISEEKPEKNTREEEQEER